MQVDRTVADRAAAGQRDGRLARAREQRPQHQDRRAHLAHDVIGRDRGGHPARAQRHHPAEILGPRALDHRRHAELVEQMAEAVDISETRQVAQRQRLVGQQRARQQRQRAVLGSGNGDTARERLAAANDDLVHRRCLAAARAGARGGKAPKVKPSRACIATGAGSAGRNPSPDSPWSRRPHR